MKTDYEFIRDKFDESEVKAPESMDEQFVLDKIADTKPQKSRKPLFASLSAAAAIAIITVAALVITNIIGGAPKPISITGNGGATLSSFKNEDEVKEAIRKINKKREKVDSDNQGTVVYEKGDSVINEDSAAVGGKGSGEGHNSTYTQYTDVDEADTVKTDGTYIYYRNSPTTITVYTTEGKNAKIVAEIHPTTKQTAFLEFYIYNGRLIAVEDNYESAIGYSWLYKASTSVEIFDISNIKNIKLSESFTQSGSYCSSRMIDGMIYVVTTHNAIDESDLPYIGKTHAATDDEASVRNLPAQNIYSVENPGDARFLVVSAIDTDKCELSGNTKAILGSADEVYCNSEHLFVTAREYDFDNYAKPEGKLSQFVGGVLTTTGTQIVKVDLKDDLKFTATTKVDGYIDNQYSLDEKDGCLRVAVTIDRNNSGNRIQSNRLYILDKNLNQVGQTTAFAENESIKAVRYVGDTAYVITYEETDPLFVIDTSDVKNPRILGEVKISGFSTMLVPVDDNTLLGIGYHTEDEDYTDLEVQEGIKLALFDISDKTNPKVIDEKVFKGYYSDVQYNHKALLVNNERGDYTIPYSYWNNSDDDSGDTTYGVINFKIDNGKIKVVDEYKSDKFHEADYLDRCAYTGDYIYMLGTTSEYNGDELDESVAAIDAVQYK